MGGGEIAERELGSHPGPTRAHVQVEDEPVGSASSAGAPRRRVACRLPRTTAASWRRARVWGSVAEIRRRTRALPARWPAPARFTRPVAAMESASKAYTVCQALPDHAPRRRRSRRRAAPRRRAPHEARERLEASQPGIIAPGRSRGDDEARSRRPSVRRCARAAARRCDPLDEVDALDEAVVGEQRERALRFVEVDERLGDPALGAVGQAAEHRGHERGERVGPARHHRARQRASLRELAPPVVVEHDLDEQRCNGRVLRLERLQRSHQELA